MHIEYYEKQTGRVLQNTGDYYFVMNGEVYRENEKTFESQCAVISFEDVIEKMPAIGWRISGA